MFAEVSNASKAAFITLVRTLKEKGCTMIDSQVYTAHMESLGATDIPRKEYLDLLGEALEVETRRGNWDEILRKKPSGKSAAPA
jgi:leucyl/phenylalanyl-tRNA--protein transferase